MYILIYQFKYVNILILRYSRSILCEIFSKEHIFFNILYNTMIVAYKISITIYSKYIYILVIHSTADGLVWWYTLFTYISSGHIHPKSRDIHMEVTTLHLCTFRRRCSHVGPLRCPKELIRSATSSLVVFFSLSRWPCRQDSESSPRRLRNLHARGLAVGARHHFSCRGLVKSWGQKAWCLMRCRFRFFSWYCQKPENSLGIGNSMARGGSSGERAAPC